MDEGLDTGDMILKAQCPIVASDTSASLYDKLAKLGPKALVDTLALMSNSHYPREPQDNALATYANKLDKAESQINWLSSAKKIDLKRRAFTPWPGSFFLFTEQSGSSHTIKVHDITVIEQDVSGYSPGEIINTDKQGILVATSENAILLKTLQLPGKKAMAAQDILNSRAQWFKKGQLITGLTCQ